MNNCLHRSVVMVRDVWRVVKAAAYRRGMHRSPKAVQPAPRPDGLDGREGLWVAIKDGHVIAGANSSGELVRRVIEMGPVAEGAVAQFVPPREDAIVIGVG